MKKGPQIRFFVSVDLFYICSSACVTVSFFGEKVIYDRKILTMFQLCDIMMENEQLCRKMNKKGIWCKKHIIGMNNEREHIK